MSKWYIATPILTTELITLLSPLFSIFPTAQIRQNDTSVNSSPSRIRPFPEAERSRCIVKLGWAGQGYCESSALYLGYTY